MLKAALYARVSTQRQEQEETIKSQIDEIERKIREDGNVLLPQHVYKDEGWSGTILARPALDAMRDGAKNHEFDILYVYDRGRLSREFYVQEMLIDELNNLEIKFYTLRDINAGNEDEKFMQGVQGLFHQYERVKIAERFRRGKMFKVKKGELLGYNPLYGYRYIPKTKEKNGYFEINEEEAEVVRMIFDWVGNKGYSLNMVIKELFRLKIYPKKRKREEWTNGPINRLIKNTSYYGDHYYNKCTGVVPKNPKSFAGKYKKVKNSSKKQKPKDEWVLIKIPAIIDKEIFDKAQKRIEANFKFSNKNRKYKYLLSGMIYCMNGHKCYGETVKQDDGNINQYYRCAERRYNVTKPKTCKEKGVNVNILDKLVWEQLLKLLTNEKLIEAQARKWLSSNNGSANVGTGKNEINKIELELSKIREEKSRYVKLYGMNMIDMDIYRQHIEDVDNRESRLLKELRTHQTNERVIDNIPKLDAVAICQKAKKFIKELNLNNQMLTVRTLVQKVVANQQQAIIHGFMPLEVNTEKVGLYATNRYRRPT
ncbi:recombinase family protein [Candidatus Microgenomates bacterium]|nr:recombinase family protein [Candidatus Microgenomates bacterium]